MKNATATFELSEQQLLEKARNSTSSLLEEKEIQGTPFKAVKQENGGWFAALGMNKLTEEFETPEQLLEWMDSNLWTLMVTVITMVVQTIDLHKVKMMKEAYEKSNKMKQTAEYNEKTGIEVPKHEKQ